MRVEAKVVGHIEINPNDRVSLDRVQQADVAYSGRTLSHFGAIGCRFEHCRFDNARVESISFGAGKQASEYLECNFDGLRCGYANGGFARFIACSFRNVILREWL